MKLGRGFALLAAAMLALVIAAVPVSARAPHRKAHHHKVHKKPLAKVEPEPGQFYSDGHAIDEIRCIPPGDGKFPIVLLLHGCAPKGFATPQFEVMCTELAQHGFYTMYIEYYGQASTPDCRDLAMVPTFSLTPNVPLPDDDWMRTVLAARTFIGAAPHADASRVGVVGFSFGATLGVITAALNPSTINAIVDYYGYSNERVEDAVVRAFRFPPTLILHGDEDRRAQVTDSIHLRDAIRKHQRDTELRIYPGVEHAFNFHDAVGYDEGASKDAWSLTLSFLERHLK